VLPISKYNDFNGNMTSVVLERPTSLPAIGSEQEEHVHQENRKKG